MGDDAIINIILESLNNYYLNRLSFIKYEYEKKNIIWLYFMKCLTHIIINKKSLRINLVISKPKNENDKKDNKKDNKGFKNNNKNRLKHLYYKIYNKYYLKS